MYEIKTEDVYEDFSKNKEIFDFSNSSAKLKYYDDSNKLFAGNMKDEAAGVVIKEFIGLKPKIYSFLVDDSSEHKKPMDVNKNVVAAVSHNEYNDVLLNNKCWRYSMNRIESKKHRIGTYEIKKVSLSYFDDKIYPKQWI